MSRDQNHRQILKKRELINIIQDLSSFSSPKLKWEQYSTDAVATADLFYYITFEQQELQDRIMIDFGCGPGHLTVAGLLLGARHVLGIDIDSEALQLYEQNLARLNLRNRVSILQADLTLTTNHSRIIDALNSIQKHNLGSPQIIGVSNPPFGVHNKGVDVKFVQQAIQVVDVLYSIHLQSDKIRRFLQRKIPQIGGSISNIGSLSMFLPHSYQHHQKKRKRILTDVYRIIPKSNASTH